MVVTDFTCKCGNIVEDWSSSMAQIPAWRKCPICGKRATRYGIGRKVGRRNASTGEIVSHNLGCGIGQEDQGNRDLADAGIDAHYRVHDGALVAANRQAFQEATACRGLVSYTDGGFSRKKIRRIRANSTRGNPRRN